MSAATMVAKEFAVIPYDIDPSLYTGEPQPAVLDDGFSPPHHDEAAPPSRSLPAGPGEAALGEISAF